MTSLFSPFDLGLFVTPFLFFFLILFLSMNFSYQIFPFLIFFKSLSKMLMEFFLSLKPKYFNKFSGLIFISIFFSLLISNLFSVFPFNFPLMSQVSVVFYYAGSIWISLIIFSIFSNFKGFLSHLIPEGTPLPLTFLLFMIEFVSSLIRPLTLTVRLAANILAGHLLMSLLSSLVFLFNLSGVLYLGLNLVEMFVALIQSYIFSTMIVLYFSEV